MNFASVIAAVLLLCANMAAGFPSIGNAMTADHADYIDHFNPQWAGAVIFKDNVSFVRGGLTVPTPIWGTVNGTSYAVLIGIDGAGRLPNGCNDSVSLQTGIIMEYDNGLASFKGWYAWLPDVAHYYDFEIQADDNVSFSIVAYSKTEAHVAIYNQRTGLVADKELNSTQPLCFSSVEWIVEDYTDSNGAVVTFPNFGTINFTEVQGAAMESGQWASVDLNDAEIWDVLDSDGRPLTSCGTWRDSSVFCNYIG
ncbi:peptidase A4 family-domain-containing protein [Apiospora arundinis]|uniref:Peptidase A4 family-domain-containing protein n=1 Tax=Apiospora arundinis TaxID=335852 RepID=A0ABR2HSL0_9PEZI